MRNGSHTPPPARTTLYAIYSADWYNVYLCVVRANAEQNYTSTPYFNNPVLYSVRVISATYPPTYLPLHSALSLNLLEFRRLLHEDAPVC